MNIVLKFVLLVSQNGSNTKHTLYYSYASNVKTVIHLCVGWKAVDIYRDATTSHLHFGE